MKELRIAAGLALTFCLAGVSPGAAQGNVDGAKYAKGATVTIQGCVMAAEGQRSYVLTRIQEWPVVKSPMGKYGPRNYWIENGAHEFMNYVGETIQITGTISDVTESEIDLKSGGAMIEIEHPHGDARLPAVDAGVRIADHPGRVDIKITLLKLKIDKLLTVMKTCLPQPR